MTDDEREQRRREYADLAADSPPGIVTREPRYQQHPAAGLPPELAARMFGAVPVKAPVWHLDGVGWADADPPPRGHQHWPQTVGLLGLFDEHWRCACGAHKGSGDRDWVPEREPRVGNGPAPRGRRRSLVGALFAVWGWLLTVWAVIVIPFDLATDVLREAWTRSPRRFGLRWAVGLFVAVVAAFVVLVAWVLLFIPLVGQVAGFILAGVAALVTGFGTLWVLGVRP